MSPTVKHLSGPADRFVFDTQPRSSCPRGFLPSSSPLAAWGSRHSRYGLSRSVSSASAVAERHGKRWCLTVAWRAAGGRCPQLGGRRSDLGGRM